MTKQEKRKIVYHFRNYEKLKQSAVISTVQWATKNMAVDYSSEKVQTSPSNYRENQLCGIIDKTSEALRWTNVIERILDHYRFDGKSDLIKLRFLQGYSIRKTCRQTGISVRTYARWQDEIFDLTLNWARELNVI